MKRLLPILFTLLLGGSVYAQWSTDPTKNMPVLKENIERMYGWETETLPNGNFYLLYQTSEDTLDYRTYLQIYDKHGETILDNALLISDHPTRSWTATNDLLFVDKDGNAIIAVSDCRHDNSENAYKNLSYSIYKISPEGEFLWSKEGLDLQDGKQNYIQARFNAIQLEEGSYIFSWMSAIAEADASFEVNLQRVSADGKILWTDKQIDGGGQSVSYPYLVNAGNNQFYIAYAKGSNQDIYVRKMDFDGESIWTEDTRVYRGGFGTVPLWTFLQVIPGPDKGVLFAWQDDRDFTNIESTYASYIKADGSFGFSSGEEGQKLGFAGLRCFEPKIVLDAQNKTIYSVWREKYPNYTHQTLKSQRLSYTGELLWDPNGVEVYPFGASSVSYVNLSLNDKGNMAVFWMNMDSVLVYKKVEAYGKSFNSEAKELWFSEISTGLGSKSSLQVGMFTQGQWVAMWQDERQGAISPLYAQNIASNGALGQRVSTEKHTFASQDKVLLKSYPNPMQNEARFLLQQEESGSVNLKIYDIRGACVATIFEGFLPKGEHELNWNSTHLSNGLYTAILQQKSAVQTMKIMISK